jgi:hypothetical protein
MKDAMRGRDVVLQPYLQRSSRAAAWVSRNMPFCAH